MEEIGQHHFLLMIFNKEKYQRLKDGKKIKLQLPPGWLAPESGPETLFTSMNSM
jgi:hypothetical protein